MIPSQCRWIAWSFVALMLAAGPSTADEIVGKVKSVDADGKKVVITATSTSKEHEVTVDSSTAWIKEKNGKVSKKFDLTKLKVGAEVEVTTKGTGTLAAKVVIKPGKKKAKDA